MKNSLIKFGKKSRKAFLNQLDSKKKNKVLKDYCQLIEKNKKLILMENKKDIKKANEKKFKDNLINRLILNDKKILDIECSTHPHNYYLQSISAGGLIGLFFFSSTAGPFETLKP